MKSTLTATLLLITLTLFGQKKSQFKSDIDFGNGSVFTTFFNVAVNGDQFTITSPEDADVRMVGGKAKLGRLLGKSPKKGIFVSITGQKKNDSLIGETTIPMFGKLQFRGIIKDKSLQGKFLRNTYTVGSINGTLSSEKRNNYAHLYPIIVQTTEDNIYSKTVLQNKEWAQFKKDIEQLCADAHDDIELFLAFNMLTKKLPFSHFSLAISKDQPVSGGSSSAQKSVIFEEKNISTAYLLIRDFATSQGELAEILPKIVGNQAYKNLIVDLRDNPGGGIEAAFEFAKHITEQDIEVGYFVTNKLNYSGYEPELFKTLPELQPKSTEEFTNDLKTTGGARLFFKKPNNPVFSGRIFLLTNSSTGSTCEPIVYSLKKSKRATVIGENSAGAMLAAVPFKVSGKYVIILPIADYYTSDGVRLDKVGVTPDISVKSEEALNTALEIINTGG